MVISEGVMMKRKRLSVAYGKEVSADEVVTTHRSQKEVGSDNWYGPARPFT